MRTAEETSDVGFERLGRCFGSSEKVRSTMKFHQRIERLECFGFPYIKILAPILLARYAR